MISTRVFLVLISCLYVDVIAKSSLEVETDNGWIRGAQLGSMYSWRGIPYAKPPVANLRFEPPEKAENWTGIWDATHDRSQCIAYATDKVWESTFGVLGQEDCLYVNVYTPKLPQDNSTLLPVMVWFYGGAFFQGSGSYSSFPPDQLVQQGVIVVTFNYRLGIFGFISTNDDVAPGNNGLRDQILALKWVQENIKAFGGNPKKVTVFGESAGAVSVSYLVLSSLTKGLFKRAIMESGSALCPWSISWSSRKAAFGTGAALGIITDNSQTLVKTLKSVSAKDLKQASVSVMGIMFAEDPLNGFPFGPVIERPGPNAVITDSSYEKLRLGHFNQVTQLMGYNNAEGWYFKSVFEILTLRAAQYDLTPATLVPVSMRAKSIDMVRIGVQIKSYYAGSGLIALPNNILKYITDNDFIRPIQETAKLTSQHVKTYFYKFSYTHDPTAVGAAHTDELPYIFNSNYNSSSDRFIRKCMVGLWTNFAKNGNPTPSSDNVCGGVNWKPLTAGDQNLNYISIDRKVTTGQNPNKEEMDFWNQLFEKYAQPPLVQY